MSRNTEPDAKIERNTETKKTDMILEPQKDTDMNDPSMSDFINSVKTNNISGVKQFVKDVNELDDAIYDMFINACKKGVVEMVKVFIEYSDRNCVDKEDSSKYYFVNKQNSAGMSGLMWATYNNQIKIVELLVNAKGIIIDAFNISHITAFAWAISYNYYDIGEMLLNKGADINTQDIWGDTLLIKNMVGSLEKVKFLLDNSAKINATNYAGNTALIHAVKSGKIPVVIALLTRGADPYIKNNDNNMAVDYAYTKEMKDILGTFMTKAIPPETSIEKVPVVETLLVRPSNDALPAPICEQVAPIPEQSSVPVHVPVPVFIPDGVPETSPVSTVAEIPLIVELPLDKTKQKKQSSLLSYINPLNLLKYRGASGSST